MRFPSTIIDLIRQAIVTHWPRGLHKEKHEGDVYEFKLNGTPWWGHGDEAVLSRILM
jgi:hypothetical protein